MPSVSWREICAGCGRSWELRDRRWLCSCGGLLDLAGPLADPLPRTGAGVAGATVDSPLGRYAASLPPGGDSVDLGMRITPLVEAGPGLFMKLDYEHPTGSFKDRGAAVMIGAAARLGVGSVVVDSSGNAGRSVAAHAARAGVDCRVFVPHGTAPSKVEAIASAGAAVVEVPGDRMAAAAAAQAAVGEGGGWYGSHVHQPLFHHGVKTLAYELFEQLRVGTDGVAAVAAVAAVGAVGAVGGVGGVGAGAAGLESGTIVVPAGNGTLVIGLWLGFGELVALGKLARMPVLVAVQADRCAPLAGRAVGAGVVAGRPAPPPTVATGIAIPAPARARQVRAALMASGGHVEVVTDEEILAARDDLTARGWPVEPTGAVAWAAAAARSARGSEGQQGPVVVVLTGRAED